MKTTAGWLAKRRILYEFPGHDPNVFGNYGPKHIAVIYRGILAELALFEYLHRTLLQSLQYLPAEQRTKAVLNRISLNICLGKADPGHDLTVAGKSLDVKNYAGVKVAPSKALNLHLLISRKELAGQTPAKLYVQTFNDENGNVILAGYHVGLPPPMPGFPTPAYARPVTSLHPMAKLQKVILNGITETKQR